MNYTPWKNFFFLYKPYPFGEAEKLLGCAHIQIYFIVVVVGGVVVVVVVVVVVFYLAE